MRREFPVGPHDDGRLLEAQGRDPVHHRRDPTGQGFSPWDSLLGTSFQELLSYSCWGGCFYNLVPAHNKKRKIIIPGMAGKRWMIPDFLLQIFYVHEIKA